jgi:hypothetical protein
VVKELEAKLAAARKVRDDYQSARRAEIRDDVEARGSLYLRAAADLKFDARSKGIDDRAKKDGLTPLHVRAVSFMWKKRGDDASAAEHPVLAPWRLFSALPKDQFAAKAPEVLAAVEAKNTAKPGAVHPLVLAAFREAKPTDMNQVAESYAALLGRLEEHSREALAKSGKKGQPLGDPEWESLRVAFFGDAGLFVPPAESDRFLLDRKQRQELTELTKKIDEVQNQAAANICRAMVMNDAPKPMDPHVFVRGNAGRPGKPVPRQFLKVLSGPDRKPFQNGSGRLELAQAIVGQAAPLTARVIVNRVWRWHFGEGLVDSPSDFGVRCDPPSHPELLEDLTAGFIADGWSIKTLHRRIMRSNVYRQQSTLRPEYVVKDARNRLLWRFNRQRLDFESLRDALLTVSGSLDTTQGGPAVKLNEAPFPPRRTIYGFIDRQFLDGVYRTFDFAVPDTTNPTRFVTTVPQQALFLMNSPFIQQQARSLAAAVGPEASGDPAAVVDRVYRQVLGRGPDDHERTRAQEFLKQAGDTPKEGLPPLAQLAQVLMLTNEFSYVD